MPSLNVQFTEAELEALRRTAEREGLSLKSFAHQAIMEASSDHRRRVLEAAHAVAAWSAELNERLA